MTGALLLKGLADLTFGGAFVSLGVAYGAILLGIKWRKSKNEKADNIAETK